jgi:hypothetical protein
MPIGQRVGEFVERLPDRGRIPKLTGKMQAIRFPIRQLLLVLLACATARGGETTPVAASDFLDSIGTQSAISRRGENFEKTVECVKYLGVRWLRSGIEGDVPLDQLIALHQLTGVRFSWGFGSGSSDLPKLLATARPLASAGALLAFEGPNEPNNWGIKYKGREGGRDKSWLAVAELQRDLYAGVKSDPLLKRYPVWSISEEGAETDNVGLQFLTVPHGSETVLPEGTRFADFANVHNYIYHPSAPGLEENKTWKCADPGPACKVDGLYGEYGRTWAKHFSGYSTNDLLTLPRVTTETGTTIWGPVTEEIHALNLLTLYLDQFKRGWSHTANYLMRDRSDEAGNQMFGFYAPDYTPRRAALYLHDFTTILNDTAASSALRPLDYSVAPQPDTVHDLLLQKSNGAWFLIVWDERIAGPDDNVVINFAKTFPAINLYDPTLGISPTQIFPNSRSVSLHLLDHPLVLEIPRR